MPGPAGSSSLMKMLIGAAVGAAVVLAAWAVRELLGLRWRRRARAAWETAQAAARRDKCAASSALSLSRADRTDHAKQTALTTVPVQMRRVRSELVRTRCSACLSCASAVIRTSMQCESRCNTT